MKSFCALLIFLHFFLIVDGQNKYWISFTDKSGVTFDPYSYFSERTIAQRIEQNIPILDSLDFPVSQAYIQKVASLADSVSWPSRWLNGIAIYTNANYAEIISKLSFVKEVVAMNAVPVLTKYNDPNRPKPLSKNSTAILKYQTERFQSDTFAAHSLDGKGIRIAVFDVGFPGVDKNPVFAHLHQGKKIIATYDFVKHKEDVYKGHWHGAATLSCIAGKTDSLNIGMATGAEFLLARTENLLSEGICEEENWMAAAEWADKQGVNIISSSLGYTFQRYFNDQMDGKTSLVSRAASIAARKGILVVNAAGNEGTNSWKFLVAPADVDSVLTVGGTDPETDCHINFSSYGPTSDGKRKPNVSATAKVIASDRKKLCVLEGTSFSTPLVAGFAACAWQAHREYNNMQLFNALEQSSHLYPYFDYANGYGTPQASRIISQKQEAEPTFDYVIINNDIKVFLREEYSHAETESALGFKVKRNFYFKIESATGKIKSYTVLLAESKEMLHFRTEDFQPGDVLTVHFEGYTKSLNPNENKE